MSWAAADKAADGDSETQMRTVTVSRSARVPAALPGRMKHQDVHDVIQVTLYDGTVLPAGLVGPFNAALAPVGPVDVVLILREPKGMWQIICYHLSLQTCGTHE